MDDMLGPHKLDDIGQANHQLDALENCLPCEEVASCSMAEPADAFGDSRVGDAYTSLDTFVALFPAPFADAYADYRVRLADET